MFADELDGPVGPVGCAVYSHEFYETDETRGFKRGVHLQVTRENPLLTQASRLEPAWGAEAQRLVREEFRHSIGSGLEGKGELVLDLAGLTFIDSMGVRTLALLSHRVGGGLVLRYPQDAVARVLELLQFDEMPGVRIVQD